MASLYLNKKKDADLYGLLMEVGSNRFCKIAKACLRALFDDKQAVLARSMATEGIKEEGNQGEYHDAGVLFRLSTTAKKDEYLKTVIDSLVPGTVSTFVKTTMRQVLGPQILLKYLLLPGSCVFVEDIKPVLFVQISVAGTPEKKQKKRKARKVASKRKAAPTPSKKKNHLSDKVAVEILPNGQVLAQDDVQELQEDKIATSSVDNLQNENNVIQAEPTEPVAEPEEMDILSMLEAML